MKAEQTEKKLMDYIDELHKHAVEKIFIARLFLLQTGKGKVCTPKFISDKKVLNLNWNAFN